MFSYVKVWEYNHFHRGFLIWIVSFFLITGDPVSSLFRSYNHDGSCNEETFSVENAGWYSNKANVAACSSSPNPKNQLVRYPYLEAIRYNDKQ